MSDTPIPERNFKLKDCLTSWDMAPSTTEAKTGGLEAVVGAYHRNLERVHALTAFPPVLVQTMMTLTRVTVTTYDKYKSQVADGSMTNAELEKKVQERLDIAETIRRSRSESGDQKMKEIMEREQKIAFDFLEKGFNKFKL